ncbi:hypothetical protein D3C78_1667750 [compost metagenome]
MANLCAVVEQPNRQAIGRRLIRQHLEIAATLLQGNEDCVGGNTGSQRPLPQQIHSPDHKQRGAVAEGKFASLQRTVEYP